MKRYLIVFLVLTISLLALSACSTGRENRDYDSQTSISNEESYSCESSADNENSISSNESTSEDTTVSSVEVDSEVGVSTGSSCSKVISSKSSSIIYETPLIPM